MVIVMRADASAAQLESIVNEVRTLGFRAHPSLGEQRSIVGVVGHTGQQDLMDHLRTLDGVEDVIRITKAYKLASREFRKQSSVVDVNGVKTGAGSLVVCAGPCGVESLEQTLEAARFAKRLGATMLRGGAYKPRTSPYSFQGLGERGLEILAEARRETGLPIVTEVTTPDLVETVAAVADVLQIGARNAQNFALLAEAGRSGRAILLKRGLTMTIEEFLMSAEYVLAQGNDRVILCERGMRTFETSTRFTLDVSSVPVLKELSHLPVWIDPSHAAGRRALVTPLALAGIAAGADGLIVEVHPHPELAQSDAAQQLAEPEFERFMAQVVPVAQAVGRPVLAAAGA